MNIFKSLEDARLLIKGVTQTIENETKEQKGKFLSMLFGTLDASLIENLLTLEEVFQAGKGETATS